MRGGTWVGATLLLAGVALAAATAAFAQAPASSSSSSSGAGGSSASASASAGNSSSSSSSSSSAAGGGGGGQQQQQQQQQGGGGNVVVVGGPGPVATGGTSVRYGGQAVPITQVFSPPQEIILSSQGPQVYTPPAVHYRTSVVRTVVYTAPPRTGYLPFSGSNVVFGLIAGFALICGGGLLLVWRRDEMLERVIAEQESALQALGRS